MKNSRRETILTKLAKEKNKYKHEKGFLDTQRAFLRAQEEGRDPKRSKLIASKELLRKRIKSQKEHKGSIIAGTAVGAGAGAAFGHKYLQSHKYLKNNISHPKALGAILLGAAGLNIASGRANHKADKEFAKERGIELKRLGTKSMLTDKANKKYFTNYKKKKKK